MKRSYFSRVVFFLTLIFLFLPLIVLVFYAFNESKNMKWTGFSLIWFERLLTGSRNLWRAFGNSVFIALSSAATATLIGTLGAIGVNWYNFRLKRYVQAVSLLPLILPEIIIGISMLIFFVGVDLQKGLLRIYIAHTTFNLPFVLLVVLSRLDEFDFSIIEAARDLGAREYQTLLRVIIPMAMPGIISAFLIAVTMSLEDFVITAFVSGPGSSTLPVYIFSMIRTGVSPVINALSVILLGGTIGLVFLMRPFFKYIARE